ncbi:uncharacterized protein LOC105425214 [Pogonomyrmex barbatus]|uniref:Uncharacterized protein LOC105425214 n=1 Tax=Pogonomyrmex barbatus TaxID=144034 RepID=A0A6I9VY54_9HYME|nr:uncharacterized protein LOC105425214 [Pogonomyrmex barbatus]
MNDIKNIVFTNNTRIASPNSVLIEYGRKSVELEVIKDTISMYRNNFLEREKILKEEKQKLDELNYQVWSLEDSLCEQIWQFSKEHDFFVIFQYHPFIMETGHCIKQRSDYAERSLELMNLSNEIDTIKTEMISLNQRRNVKREVETALTKLRKLQLISDDATELLRLVRPPESLCKLEMISVPLYDEVIPNENKIKRRKKAPGRLDLENSKPGLMPKKELIITKNYPQLPLERSIVLTTNTMITNVFTQSTSNKRFKRFTLKKRSEISIRFQEYREHNNYY